MGREGGMIIATWGTGDDDAGCSSQRANWWACGGPEEEHEDLGVVRGSYNCYESTRRLHTEAVSAER